MGEIIEMNLWPSRKLLKGVEQMNACLEAKKDTNTNSASLLISTYQDQIKTLTREVNEIVRTSKTLLAKSAKK